MSDVDLSSLIGTRTLTALYRGFVNGGEDRRERRDDAMLVRLTLDGRVYQFEEDPDDGYRSMLGSVQLVDTGNEGAAPIDPPLVVEVRGRCTCDRTSRWHRTAQPHIDMFYAVDERTGLVVLEVGTDHEDGYYPSFVFDWSPEGRAPKWLEGKETP